MTVTPTKVRRHDRAAARYVTAIITAEKSRRLSFIRTERRFSSGNRLGSIAVVVVYHHEIVQCAVLHTNGNGEYPKGELFPSQRLPASTSCQEACTATMPAYEEA